MRLHVSRLLWLVRVQNHLLHLAGGTSDTRAEIFSTMLRRDARERTSYWLQLTVALAIATFGLVLGSTAVVIGAMLVAPLMTPIVALAMGLSAGSPFLVLRSVGRIGLSVSYVIVAAAVITSLLPFHETNAEIAARTAPTALDLFTAAFCALAGAYASLRPGSDTTSAAAGTSIGISLVPPLCVSGFGIGIGNASVAAGAALLFLTNFVAIVAVGTVIYLVLGFNRVAVTALEQGELGSSEDARVSRYLAGKLAVGFESRWGPLLRFAMPFVLLAIVSVPLSRALNEVTWEVRVRTAIDAALGKAKLRIVDTRIRLDHHQVEVGIVMLGRQSEARDMQRALSAEIERIAAVAPRVEVVAIPDADQLAGLERSLVRAPVPLTPSLPTLDVVQSTLDAHAKLDQLVHEAWPKRSTGALVGVQLMADDPQEPRLLLVHLGAALSPDALELLQRAIAAQLHHELPIDARPLARHDLHDIDAPRLLALGEALQLASLSPSVHTCVVVGNAPPARGDAATDEWLRAHLRSQPRSTVVVGTEDSVWFSETPCEDERAVDEEVKP